MTAGAIQRLKDLVKTDATVSQFFNSLDKYSGFDDMVVNLAIQLSKEKAHARKQVRDLKQNKEIPTIFGLGTEHNTEKVP